MTTERVSLSVNPPAAFALPDLSEESANWASIILTENHRIHDMYFNDSGFHNHIVHHITTSYSLGATPSSLQSHYEKNKSYQLPLAPDDGKLAQKLRDGDDDYFIGQMGDRSLYSTFLSFFKGEIKERGYALVLNEFLFKGDKRANTIFNRLFAGILHPIIHLGFGVEFEQPAIIAEGLAEACTHGGWSDSFFEEVQDYATDNHPQRKSAKQILDDIRVDEKVSKASRWDDANHMRDGTLARARKEAIRHAAAWQVDERGVEEAAAEMINAAAYFTGAAQRRQHEINFDFFFLHSLNASILIAALLRQEWISAKNKAKLVEWKVRFDVIQYASKRSPELHLDEIVNYKPEHSGQSDWKHIFARAAKINDDGHTSKMIRALAYGERCCKPFEDKQSFPMKGPLWLQMCNMVMDHAEATDASWIFGAGFDEAWKDVGPRSGNAQL